ncbi:hypothetical protein ABVK25_010816 [Lepraria finkii]|uniref:Uncharacterized protein n=1 Tax=Lepraria finkii TaxID=1340010 RepID=A0ABR4AUZ5_9LECA
MAKDEVTPVNDIAHDDQKLEEKASASYGADLVLDPKETTGTDFESVDSAVCAILVKKDGGAGAVTYRPQVWQELHVLWHPFSAILSPPPFLTCECISSMRHCSPSER